MFNASHKTSSSVPKSVEEEPNSACSPVQTEDKAGSKEAARKEVDLAEDDTELNKKAPALKI